ncbi:hypothetical protein ACHAXA_005071 [Cyclostephanos tholiformis]|uniref:PDZ domain-containing protein n=1 Tax=Cyclostephanos tholiformis TaxID=382380 RepID=A0ABD3SSC9_9STRA
MWPNTTATTVDAGEGGGEADGENLVVAQMLTGDDSEGDREGGAGGGRNDTALIVSATSAGVSCIIILALGVHFARMRRGGMDATTPETKSDMMIGPSATAVAASSSNDEEGYFGSIRVREWASPEAIDISTLGETYAGETLGYEVDNFDDTAGGRSFSSKPQYYTKMKSNMECKTVHSDESPMMVSAGTTVEDLGIVDCSNLDLFKVIVPAGKLGIVLDNPSGDLPVVHAVGKTSILRDEVHVGDMLLFVDEVNCRGMSCRDVSAIMGSRQHLARTLVLARGSRQ